MTDVPAIFELHASGYEAQRRRDLADADCLFKDHRFAVRVARRSG
jgi:hypothetical protein